jgi:hypothetical protein
MYLDISKAYTKLAPIFFCAGEDEANCIGLAQGRSLISKKANMSYHELLEMSKHKWPLLVLFAGASFSPPP